MAGVSNATRTIALATLGFALVVRLGVLVIDDWQPIFDSADYDRHARSLVSGDGYPDSMISGPGDPTAMRMPLYPLFLGFIYEVTGHGYEAARAGQAILGTATVGLIGLLGFRLFGRTIALIAMALAAVFPPLILLGTTLMSENVLVPLVLGAVLAVLQHRRSPAGYRWALAAGALIGLAMLTRPNALVLLLPLGFGIWTAQPRVRMALGGFLIAAVLVYAPWPIRNALTLNDFVPLSTELGLVMTGVYNDYSRLEADDKPGQWFQPWELADEYRAIYKRTELTEPELDRELRAAGLDYILEHPVYPFEVAFWNTARVFHLTGQAWDHPYWASAIIGISRPASDVGLYSFYPVLLLALVGAFGAARRAPLFVWMVPVLLWASVMFLGNETRSRSPVDAFLLILAALGIATIWDASRRRGPHRRRDSGEPLYPSA